jgi:hypothetical protein
VAPVLPRATGHVEASELPRAGSESRSHRDTWQARSCPQPEGGSHCLDLMLVRGVSDPQGTDKFPARSCHQASFLRRSFVCRSVFQLSCIGARSSHSLYSSPAHFWSGGDFLHVFSPSPVHSDRCSAWASIRRPALFPSAFVRREEAYLQRSVRVRSRR